MMGNERENISNTWDYQTPGIPTDRFIQGELPLTKREVRTISISQLRLKDDHVVYDIGAGTGTVSVEIALQVREGRVFAVEKEKEGADLIRKNTDKFAVPNVEIIRGEAPEVLSDLPACDRIFIGGSGGRLKEILQVAVDRLKTGGRLVINAITINTLITAWQELKKKDFKVEITQLAAARTRNIGDYDMLKALNPVFIITAVGELN